MVVGGEKEVKLTNLEKVDAKLTALDCLKGLHNKFDNDIKTFKHEKQCIQKRSIQKRSNKTRGNKTHVNKTHVNKTRGNKRIVDKKRGRKTRGKK